VFGLKHNTGFSSIHMSVSSPAIRPSARSALHIQRAVLFALVIRELRARVEGRWVGLVWMLVEPLAHVLIILSFYGFRSHAVSASVELPVFLITGMLPFFIFRNLMKRLPNAVGASRNLYAYRQVKPIDGIVARGIVEVGLYSAVYLIALALLGWLGYHWLPHEPLELMAVSVVLVGLGTAFGLLFAVLFHNRPKVQTVVGWIFYPLYFASGVIFPIQGLSQVYREWLLWNPVLHLIELSRAHFIPNYQALQDVNLWYPASWLLVVTALALSLYRVYRFRFLAVE
jgi:capsular polysaccharide transport system permease protein